MRLPCLLILCCCCGMLAAADYYADPSAADGGVGSQADPWPDLETCIETGKLTGLVPGDTLYLLSGYHGFAQFSGVNADFITIAAAPGAQPQLSRLVMNSAAKWHIKDLTISASFGAAYSGYMVSFCDSGTGNGQIILEGCYVFGVADHSGLDAAAWMGLNSGVLMGRHGDGSIVRDCHIRNTRFALSLTAYDGIAEGNIIGAYSADGMRITRDGEIARDNVIKGAFVGSGDGDANHDDAIQCFLFNVGTGTVRDISIQRNIILGHDPDGEALAAVNQGIGFFDGPLVDFLVEDNVVNVSHWHGISLYDAQACTIRSNTVWNDYANDFRPWIRLDNKLGLADGNSVSDNYAVSFSLDEPNTTATNNQTTTKAIYDAALATATADLLTRYSEYHRTSGLHRISEEEAPSDDGNDTDTGTSTTTQVTASLSVDSISIVGSFVAGTDGSCSGSGDVTASNTGAVWTASVQLDGAGSADGSLRFEVGGLSEDYGITIRRVDIPAGVN